MIRPPERVRFAQLRSVVDCLFPAYGGASLVVVAASARDRVSFVVLLALTILGGIGLGSGVYELTNRRTKLTRRKRVR